MIRILEQIFSRNSVKINSILDFKIMFKDVMVYNDDYNLYYTDDEIFLNFKNGDKTITRKFEELIIEGEVFKSYGEYKFIYKILSKDNTLTLSDKESKLYSLKQELSIDDILKLNILDLDIVNFKKEEPNKILDYYHMNNSRDNYYKVYLKIESKKFYVNIYQNTYKDLMKALYTFEYYLSDFVLDLDNKENEKFLELYKDFKNILKNKDELVKEILSKQISIYRFKKGIELQISKENTIKFLEVF